MDNLSTHRPGALYEAFPPAEAKDLWEPGVRLHPQARQWLNVALVVLNVLARCVNRPSTRSTSYGAEAPPGRLHGTGSGQGLLAVHH